MNFSTSSFGFEDDDDDDDDNSIPFSLDSIQESTDSILRQERLQEEIDVSKAIEEQYVPTDVESVKLLLRKYGQPITLFGERPEDRSRRLKEFLVLNEITVNKEIPVGENDSGESKKAGKKRERPKGEFFTKGIVEVKNFRENILIFSIKRARDRVKRHNELTSELNSNDEKKVGGFLKREIQKQRDLSNNLKQFTLIGSQKADIRPVQAVDISPSGKKTISGSWSGTLKLWNTEELENCKRIKFYKAHTDKISSVVFNPENPAVVKNTFSFASASFDKTVKLWCYNKKKPLHVFEGHSYHRFGKLAIHPTSQYIGSASFDGVFHIYDVNKCKVLYEQEGHSTEIYSIAFHPDGSLCATCDFGGIIRVWDLRNGMPVMHYGAHCRKCLCLDFSPNGYHIASGGDDNIVKIYNMRKKKREYTLPAHLKLISDIKFEKENGRFLVTSSYDKTIRIWRSTEFSHVKTLTGHESIVMCLGISKSQDVKKQVIVSSGYDKGFKMWKIPETTL